MTIFVTGATGHLGVNLTRGLVARGDRVRALVRGRETPASLRGLPLEYAHGDLDDEDALCQHMAGCDAVFHLAAVVSLRARDRDLLHAVNVLGTRRVMSAALRAGVRRVVHCSSVGAIGRPEHAGAGARPSDEDDLLRCDEDAADYDGSKALAETEVLRAAARGLDVCIVNPTGIVGPYDYRPSLMGQTILDFARGRLPVFVPGAYDFVSVSDVVRGHLLALERGRRGERYILGGEDVELAQVFDWLSQACGRPAPAFRLPAKWLLPVVRVKDAVTTRWFPEHHPRFTRHSIRLLVSGKKVSSEKARRELGYAPGPVREGFEAAVRWFRDEGLWGGRGRT